MIDDLWAIVHQFQDWSIPAVLAWTRRKNWLISDYYTRSAESLAIHLLTLTSDWPKNSDALFEVL